MMSGVIAGVLAREHPAGPAESGQHFVGNHQHAVRDRTAAARRPEIPRGQRSCRRRPAASARRARAATSSSLARARACFAEVASRQSIWQRRRVEAQRTAVAVRRVRAIDVEQHRRERPREHRVLAGRHRADRVAVIGVMQRDERLGDGWPWLLQYCTRQLHRHFDRRRAVVRVEDAGQPARQDADEPLGEFDGRAGACSRRRSTCSSPRACAASASFSRGCEWPWMFTHHDEVPSSSRRPSSV